MGWFYYASLRCKNEWIARDLADRYSGQTFVFGDEGFNYWNAVVCRIKTDFCKGSDEDAYWVNISPTGVTSSGIATNMEGNRAMQFANVICGMLRNEKHFDFAAIDVEPEEFTTLEELKKDLASGDGPDYKGIIVSNAVLESIGSRHELHRVWGQEFSKTHRWVPFRDYSQRGDEIENRFVRKSEQSQKEVEALQKIVDPNGVLFKKGE